MKKLYALLPILAALLVPGKASAQMLPDSTVQVVAYWEVGDQVDYLFTEEKYEINGEDETMKSSSSETVRFEVAAATDSTYTLLITSLDGFATNLNLSDKDLAAFPPFNLRVRMSDLGEFQELENLDEILKALDKMVPLFKKATLASLTPEEQKAIDKKGLEDYLRQSMASESFVNKILQQYLVPFIYHGARMDTTRTYSFMNNFEAVIGEKSLNLETRFKVDPELTDEYSVVIRQETVADGVDIIPLLQGFLGPLAENLYSGAGRSREEVEAELSKLRLEAVFEEYNVEEIELATGWPLVWVFDRYVTVTENGETRGAHNYKKIKILSEEGEEE